MSIVRLPRPKPTWLTSLTMSPMPNACIPVSALSRRWNLKRLPFNMFMGDFLSGLLIGVHSTPSCFCQYAGGERVREEASFESLDST